MHGFFQENKQQAATKKINIEMMEVRGRGIEGKSFRLALSIEAWLTCHRIRCEINGTHY